MTILNGPMGLRIRVLGPDLFNATTEVEEVPEMLCLEGLLACRGVTKEWLDHAIRDEQKRLWRMQETIQQDLNVLEKIQSQLK